MTGRAAAKQREVRTWVEFSFVEDHSDHLGEGSAKLVEIGSCFPQLISTVTDGIQILPGFEVQGCNLIQDVIAGFPSAAFSSSPSIWISKSIIVTSVSAFQHRDLKNTY